MARRKPMDMKGLKKSFQSDLDLEEYKRSPNRYTQGGERQSDAYPSAARPASPQRQPTAPKARPAAKAPPRSAPRGGPVPPLPPPRPRGPEGTPPIPPGPPGPVNEPPIPFQIPQYDPMGNPTGPMAPPAPASSTQGWGAPPQPTDMIPPMTGPGADRMSAAVGPTQLGGLGSLPTGQSAASLLFGGGGAPPPVPGPTNAPGPVLPPPMAGPQADRAVPPPGLLDSINSGITGAGDFLKRNIPPLRF